jgi:opacity protein-like surface antigen
MKIFTKPAVLLVAFLFGSSVHAQTGNFEGFAAGFGGSTLSTNVKLSAGALAADGIGRSSIALDVNADYGFSVSDRAVVLVGGSYGLINPTVFKDEVLGLPSEIKFTKRWSAFAAPGITFGDSALLYTKIAYISGTPKSDDFAGLRHSGYGYGIGARFLLNQNIYVNAEFMQNSYETREYTDLGLNVSAKSTVGTVSVGYSF